MKEMTIAELTELHGIPRQTLNSAAQAGFIPARKAGKIWMVDTKNKQWVKWLAKHQGRKVATPEDRG